MSIQLRKLKAMVLGQTSDVDAATATLRDAAVPVSTDDCRTCADPCDLGELFCRFLAVGDVLNGVQGMRSFRTALIRTARHSCWVR